MSGKKKKKENAQWFKLFFSRRKKRNSSESQRWTGLIAGIAAAAEEEEDRLLAFIFSFLMSTLYQWPKWRALSVLDDTKDTFGLVAVATKLVLFNARLRGDGPRGNFHFKPFQLQCSGNLVDVGGEEEDSVLI